MTDLIEGTLHRLGEQMPGRVSRPGDDRYAAATAIWAKPVGRMPRAVVHCRTPEDVQSGIRILGGSRASDVVAVTDPLRIAAVTGSVGAVGMTGLTLGGGYGPLIGRFGLALDNLLAAEVVLADGRIVTAKHDSEEELFWALRGGGGNLRRDCDAPPSARSA
jgi:hypothetical protein